jgi:Tfp pilus assembly protein PilF
MAKKGQESGKSSFFTMKVMRIIIILTALFLYGKTVKFEYVLDDILFITSHPIVQQGVSGIATIFSERSLDYISTEGGQQPYRPLTLVTFAIEKTLFDNNPAIAHFVNVILLLLLSLGIFELLMTWFPKIHKHILFIVVLLFIAHPIHTEVIANVKSRDELLNMLFGIYSLLFFWKYNSQSNKRDLAVSVIFFMLALLSKESAVTWLAIYPLSLFFFNDETVLKSVKKSVVFIVPALLFIMVWFLVNRSSGPEETNDIINNVLFGASSLQESIATKIYILGNYLWLLLIPVTLSWDYSFNQIPLVGFNSIPVWATLVVIGGLTYWTVRNFTSRKIAVFWILFFASTLSLSSNLVIEIGATMAERFLFIPSLAFVFALAWGLLKLFKVDLSTFTGIHKTKYLLVIILVFGLYSAKTMRRINVWENDFTLAESGVLNAPNSSRTQFNLAVHAQNKAKLEPNARKQRSLFELSESSYKSSLEIYPAYSECRYNLGVMYFETGRTALALQEYKTNITHNPNHENSLNNIGIIYFNERNYDEASMYFEKVIQVNPAHPDAIGNLGAIAHNQGDLEKAIFYYEKSIAVDPTNQLIVGNMIKACNKIGDVEKANKYQKLLK